jgi:hypothetical protein
LGNTCCTFDLQDYLLVYSVRCLLQSRFVQQIELEVIHVDDYNHCLDNRSIVCLTAAKFESFIFSVTCLALANGANNNIVMIAYNARLLPASLCNVVI